MSTRDYDEGGWQCIFFIICIFICSIVPDRSMDRLTEQVSVDWCWRARMLYLCHENIHVHYSIPSQRHLHRIACIYIYGWWYGARRFHTLHWYLVAGERQLSHQCPDQSKVFQGQSVRDERWGASNRRCFFLVREWDGEISCDRWFAVCNRSRRALWRCPPSGLYQTDIVRRKPLRNKEKRTWVTNCSEHSISTGRTSQSAAWASIINSSCSKTRGHLVGIETNTGPVWPFSTKSTVPKWMNSISDISARCKLATHCIAASYAFKLFAILSHFASSMQSYSSFKVIVIFRSILFACFELLQWIGK